METPYDLVVFGATGFTGQFVVEELGRLCDKDSSLKWAIAGRSMEKLQQTLTTATKITGINLDDIPIIIADVKNQESLNEMCKKAKVVLNCVGPYRFFGEPVVRAAVENGAHHIDISGEPQFLEGMQLKFNQAAKEAGVFVIGACGFDSIPADMGAIFTRDQFEGDLNHIESYLAMRSGPEGGGGHYATWQSAIHGFANARELIKLRKQMALTPLPRSKDKPPKRSTLHYNNDVNSWAVPFPGSDRSVVNRTQRFNYEVRNERPLQYQAYFRMPGLLFTLVLMFFGAIFGLLANFSFGRNLLERYPRFFSGGVFSHEGPTRKQIAGSSFSMTFIGEGYSKKVEDASEQHSEAPDRRIIARVSGPEAGYVTTPICMIQAALVLLQEKDNLPKSGGVLTPGAVFAKTTLINRLQENNMKFTVMVQEPKK
ncbi:unnamed protein product [Owenia fusiformis]|uniref:Uncharacterized protein n=1 Tax=Owenia fusiformis TaxID=6347 RepID=A0A8J1XZ28_OWEFU|nr:unnamed protein product [Owenia fusiformis]